MTRVLPLVLGVLGGCVTDSPAPIPIYDPGDPAGPGPGSPYPTPTGGEDSFCLQDSDCNPNGGSAYICSRVEECLMPSEVRTLHVRWTVSGQAAGSASCASAPALELELGITGEGEFDFGWAPVPCVEGEFTVLAMPSYYTQVGLLREYDAEGGVSGVLDGSGNASLDLPY